MNKIQLTIYNIFKEIDSICKKNNINYYLLGGTLLGAVRHKGFIPWDDDLDIGMKREDYDKFIGVFSSPSLSLHKPGDRGYCYPFVKISDNKTIIKENRHVKSHGFGIYVDVFPLDYIPNDAEDMKKYFVTLNRIKYFWKAKTYKTNNGNFIRKMLFYITKFLMFFVPYLFITKRMDGYSKKYTDTNYLGNAIWGYQERETTRVEVFKESISLDFEDGKYNAPKGYDEWLTNIFGDYMKLPPEEKRVPVHDYEIIYLDKE